MSNQTMHGFQALPVDMSAAALPAQANPILMPREAHRVPISLSGRGNVILNEVAYAPRPVSRFLYIVLGLLFGGLGIHNFYAKHYRRGFCQMAALFVALAFAGAAPAAMVPGAPMWTGAVVFSALVFAAIALPAVVLFDLVKCKTDGLGRPMV